MMQNAMQHHMKIASVNPDSVFLKYISQHDRMIKHMDPIGGNAPDVRIRLIQKTAQSYIQKPHMDIQFIPCHLKDPPSQPAETLINIFFHCFSLCYKSNVFFFLGNRRFCSFIRTLKIPVFFPADAFSIAASIVSLVQTFSFANM